MNTFLQGTTTRVWKIGGLAGMVLLVGLLLGEGQARTYTPEQAPIQVKTLDRSPIASKSLEAKRGKAFQERLKPNSKVSIVKNGVVATKPEKKRMGLAILFLGILADES